MAFPTRAVMLLALLAAPVSGARDKVAEASLVVRGLLEGQLTVNQAVLRLSGGALERQAAGLLADAAVRASSARAQQAALEVLSQVALPGDGEAERLFVRAAGQDELAVKMAGVRGLGRTRSGGQLALVESLLAEPRSGVRREAARTLGAIGQARSARPLLAAAKAEQDPETRALLLQNVGRTGTKSEAPALEAFLSHGSGTARYAALQSLCLLGAASCEVEARKLLGSTDVDERLSGVKLFEGVPARRAGKSLAPALADSSARVRAAAGRVLYQGGEAARLSWLVLQAQAAQGDDRLRFEEELEALRLTDEARQAILRQAGKK